MSSNSNLMRLCYASKANFTARSDQGVIEPSVARILMQSRKNNPRKEVGGVLHYADGCFFQCLDDTVIDELLMACVTGIDPTQSSTASRNQSLGWLDRVSRLLRNR